MDIVFASLVVFLILFIVPIIIYSLAAALLGLKEPKKKGRFFLGVVIQKLATTFGFVALFIIGGAVFADYWIGYGLIWFAMFAVTEIGQTFMGDYSKKEAYAGIVSELIYFPLAAFALLSIL